MSTTRSFLVEPYRRRERRKSVGDSPLKCEPRILAPLFAQEGDWASNPVTRSAGVPTQAPSRDEKSPVLQLVPKCVSKLVALGKQGEALAKKMDPQSEWTLDELREELEALQGEQDAPRLHAEVSWSWKADLNVADFNRANKPFVMRAYDTDEEDDDSGTESDSDGTGSSQESPEVPKSVNAGSRSPLELGEFLLSSTERVSTAIYEADRARRLRLQEELRQRRTALEAASLKELKFLEKRIQDVMQEQQKKREAARRTEKQYQRSVAEQRDKHLSDLQRDHEQRSQVEERKIRKEEESVRKELAIREEMQRAEREKAEAEARLEVERIDKERRQKEAAAAAAQKLEAEKAAKEEADRKSNIVVSTAGHPMVAKSAAEAEANRRHIMAEVDKAYQPLLNNPKDLKFVNKNVTKLVNQVATGAHRVRTISSELVQMLNFGPPMQQYIISRLRMMVVSQCEGDIFKSPSNAYALAQVIVNVATAVPIVMDGVLLSLNDACCFTVPKYYPYRKSEFSSEHEHNKLLGYAEDESGNLEATSIYMKRMSAYVALYAAIIQTGGSNPYGLSNGWRWMAQLLNHLPVNRHTASALLTFLEFAGSALYRAYGNAFMKLLATIQNKYFPALQQADPEPALLKSLETYILTKAYAKRVQAGS